MTEPPERPQARAPLEPPEPLDGRPGPAYVLVVGLSLVLGSFGVLPFLSVGYAVTQWVLAPLGVVAADPTNDDGLAALVVAGVVAPVAILAAWVFGVRGLTLDRALVPALSWLLAVVAFVVPTGVFLLVRSA